MLIKIAFRSDDKEPSHSQIDSTCAGVFLDQPRFATLFSVAGGCIKLPWSKYNIRIVAIDI